jgi:hypothetical protein
MKTARLISTDTTYVSRRQSDKNFYYSNLLHIGVSRFYGPNQACLTDPENNALLKFGSVSLLPPLSTIVSAKIYLYVDAAGSEGTKGIGIYANLEAFDGQSVTWMTRPRSEALPRAVVQFSKAYVPGYVFCDITELAAGWYANPEANFGITLKANRRDPWLILASSMHSQTPPYITLDYYTNCEPHIEGSIENKFAEHVFDVGGYGESFSPAVDMASADTATFFVRNTSDGGLQVNLQISPDDMEYADDAQTFDLPAGGMIFAAPYYFAKYNRVRIRSQNPQSYISAKIWCQVQTRNYYMHQGLC